MGSNPTPDPERRIHVLSLFYHPPLKVGGAERRFLEVARRWEEAIQHTVLEPSPPLYDLSVVVPVPHSDPSTLNDLVQGGLYGLAAVRRGVRQRPDLVLATNNIVTHVVPAYLLARLRRVPWVVVVHHFEVLPEGEVETSLQGIYRGWRFLGRGHALVRAVANRIALWLTRKADGVLAVSEPFSRLFNRAVVSGNGIDAERFPEAPGLPRQPQACFVGRLNAGKGVFDLLEVWAKLAARGLTDCRLLLMGQDGVGIEREIARRGLEGTVTYLGEVSEEEKLRRLQSCALFVTASRSEGWGIGIGEALAAGLRVICYDLPTLRSVWDHCPHVDRVPVGDVDEFARRVAEKLRQDAPAQGTTRACVEDFSWDTVAERDLRFVRDVISRSRSGP